MANADAEWTRREELADLLRKCRSRQPRPPVPGSRSARPAVTGLRQEDAASIAGLSLRRYASFERGEFRAPAATVDQVATALGMSEAERSALHVLAAGQDPPRPVSRLLDDPDDEPGGALRNLVDQLDPYPAAVLDEKWSVRHYNAAMDAWAAGWFSSAGPDERHLILFLFSEAAGELLPDAHALREHAVAAWRYQYTRNLGSRGFTGLVAQVTGSSAEAAELWDRHEIAFPQREIPVKVCLAGSGVIEADVVLVPVSPRVWLFTVVLPPVLRPPA